MDFKFQKYVLIRIQIKIVYYFYYKNTNIDTNVFNCRIYAKLYNLNKKREKIIFIIKH